MSPKIEVVLAVWGTQIMHGYVATYFILGRG
jgi:hypothetical protein